MNEPNTVDRGGTLIKRAHPTVANIEQFIDPLAPKGNSYRYVKDIRLGKRMPFGKYRGQLFEGVFLKFPEYIPWLKQQSWQTDWPWIEDIILRCANIFDLKQLICATCAGACNGTKCDKTPIHIRLSGRETRVGALYRCGECDLSQQSEGDMSIDSAGYLQTLDYIRQHDGNWDTQRRITLAIANAKGLGGNVRESDVIAFFYGQDAAHRH